MFKYYINKNLNSTIVIICIAMWIYKYII